MKKRDLKLNRKLTLNKETVASLAASEQIQVQGGESNLLICFNSKYTCASQLCTFAPGGGGTTTTVYEPTMPTVGSTWH